MCRPTYIQQQLGRLAPVGIKPAGTIRFHILLGVEDGRVALRFEQERAREKDRAAYDYVAIEEDMVVEVTLHGDQLYFSKEMDAVTTKEELSFFYGGLEYDGYEEKLDRYRIARFAARHNSGGKYDTTHGFNVNVDFLQRHDEAGPKWIAMTIDPDIKNPPPMRKQS
ncbi:MULTISPECIES: nucleotide synthetase [unclassified Sphingomonas]|uniref:nucleotide synthetase n=1 Tax=unclassified Sphingomonas TaxID=196159 RepID=UPI000A6A68DE|nr:MULTISPECIES: nucleotide synthetase [unclassified Sphingomonas]